jgi:hypothetical protein
MRWDFDWESNDCLRKMDPSRSHGSGGKGGKVDDRRKAMTSVVVLAGG